MAVEPFKMYCVSKHESCALIGNVNFSGWKIDVCLRTCVAPCCKTTMLSMQFCEIVYAESCFEIVLKSADVGLMPSESVGMLV